MNFPSFYYGVLKRNVNACQYDIGNILLLGYSRTDLSPCLSDRSISLYVSGKQGIKRKILKEVQKLPIESVVERLKQLQFQDVVMAAERGKRLLFLTTGLSQPARNALLEI